MGEITSGCTIRYGATVVGDTEIIVETANTADTADTVVLDLSTYGIVDLLTIEGYVHTTEGSVVVAEAPTCAVSSGDLTITVGGSTVSDKKRVYVVKGKGGI